MKGVKFISKPQLYRPNNSFIAHLSGIKGKDNLFKELSNKLKLPSYFGFNWDALSDCLKDFHWIEEQYIVLIHNELPILDEASFNTYIQILVDSVQDWKEGEGHHFEIVFPKQHENLILNHIGEL